MKKYLRVLPVLLIALAMLFYLASCQGNVHENVNAASQGQAESASAVTAEADKGPSEMERYNAAIADGKPILIDFFSPT